MSPLHRAPPGAAVLVAILAATGCGGPPAGIPASPGDIDAATLPDLITVGSPDLPFLLWLTPSQLASQDWRACPKVFLREDGVTATAGDCVDSSGVRWYGTATLTYDAVDGRESVILEDFGADDGEGGWIADGRVDVRYVDSGTGFLIDTNVAVTSLSGEQSVLFWAKTSSAYANYGGVWYADRHDGTVGKEGWGTAEITTRNAPLAFVYDCGWAAHISGSMAFDGTNDAFVSFYTGPLGISLPPPADTGETETGDTADTGGSDTGDTADTGADTGDTGDTDDSGDDTDTSDWPDFDDDDDPDGACGTCRDAEIDGADMGECLDLGRSFSWPFPPPF